MSAPLIRSLLPWLARDCSLELPRAAVNPPRRVQRPLVLPRRRDAHVRVCQTALNAPKLVPKPLEPRRGQPPRLRRALDAGPSDATAPVSAPSRYISGVRPRSGDLDLTRADLIAALRSRSNRPSLFPLTRAPAPRPGWSARPGSLTPCPRLSVASVRAPARSNPGC
jgi:hypothetical protein